MTNYLIVTASIGSGHERAAKAIAEIIQSNNSNMNVKIVDFMSRHTSIINSLMKNSYLGMLSLMPNLYEFIYNFTAGPKRGSVIQTGMAAIMAQTMKSIIDEHEPDVVICTHPFPADAVSHLNESWRRRFLSVAVITDYSVHPMWVCPNMDFYFVACDFMKEQLYQEGIDKSTIYVTGIPVSQQFCDEATVKADGIKLRQELEISNQDKLILLMGGGLGLGGMENALNQLEQLKQKLQLLVIAGRNKELYNQAMEFARRSHHHITVWGFTERIPQAMGAADLLISKPGALTLTEAMSIGTPMLLHEPIPGPETDNAAYMAEHGVAIWLQPDESLAKAVEQLMLRPEQLAEMSECAAKTKKVSAARDIFTCIEGFRNKK